MRGDDGFFERDDVTMVVSDSGLGGLSVTADLVELLKSNGAFRRVRVIFFDCMPSAEVGFDAMESQTRRWRVFSRALDCMVEHFAADAILLACNSISVLYERTEFARRAPVPVLGIVGLGTDLIAAHLETQPDAQVILFAAPTTVQSGVHKRILTARGFAGERLLYRSCDGLFGAIECDSRSASTRALVERHVAGALRSVPDLGKPVVASLNCTHFGFVEDLFREAFRHQGVMPAAVLDPTGLMAGAFLAAARPGRFAATEVSVEVVGQTPHANDRKVSMARQLAARSEQTAAAVLNDVCQPGLFSAV